MTSRSSTIEQSREIDEKEKKELDVAAAELSGQDLRRKKREIADQYRGIRLRHKYLCGSLKYPYGSGDHDALLKAHKAICEAIGLTHNVTIHGLRHTYVTHY